MFTQNIINREGVSITVTTVKKVGYVNDNS